MTAPISCGLYAVTANLRVSPAVGSTRVAPDSADFSALTGYEGGTRGPSDGQGNATPEQMHPFGRRSACRQRSRRDLYRRPRFPRRRAGIPGQATHDYLPFAPANETIALAPDSWNYLCR